MKTAYRIIGIILCVILTFYMLIHVTYVYRDYTNLMGFYDVPDDKADVVVLGTSVTFSTFMPMQAWEDKGMASVDYCTNAMMMSNIVYALKDVSRTQSPKLIMIDVIPIIYGHYAGCKEWTAADEAAGGPGGANYEFIKYNLDGKRYSMDRFRQVYDINRDNGGDFASYWFWYFDIARCHNKKPKISQFFNTKHDVNLGYMHLPKNEGAAVDTSEITTDNGEVIAITGKDLMYLDELAAAAQAVDAREDTDIVFYCPPVYFSAEDSYGRKNFLRDYFAYYGLKFEDFSGDIEKIGLDKETDFWGRDHFDALGAQKTTKLLTDYISENFDIPDRRGDANYSYWEENAPEWDEMLKEYIEKDMSN